MPKPRYTDTDRYPSGYVPAKDQPYTATALQGVVKNVKALDDFTKRVFGRTRTFARSNEVCVCCGGPAAEFKNELSKREFGISGMCQKCQDGVFDS